jgi:hypothetical protein
VKGKIVAVDGSLVVAEMEDRVVQNSVGHCVRSDGTRLLSEVIRVRGQRADLQVFEETRGLRIGDPVEFEEEMLSVALGPGLLGQIYDGLQNPLPKLAAQVGYFLEPGVYIHGLDTQVQWPFTPRVKVGDTVLAGHTLGTVPEGIFKHQIMVPFGARGSFKVEQIVGEGSYTITDEIAVLSGESGTPLHVTMQQNWPVKVPLSVARRRLMPTDPLVTRVRIIDSMFPDRPRRHVLHSGPVRRGQDRAAADHLETCRDRYRGDRRVRRAGGRGGGDAPRFPRVDRPAHRPQPDGADDHYLQHVGHAGRGPRGVGLHRGDAGRILPADGAARAAAGRLDLALGPGHAGAVGPPGRDSRRGSFPGLSGEPDRGVLRACRGARSCRTAASAP